MDAERIHPPMGEHVQNQEIGEGFFAETCSERIGLPQAAPSGRKRYVLLESFGLSDLARSGFGEFPSVECSPRRSGRGCFSMTGGAPYLTRVSEKGVKLQLNESGRFPAFMVVGKGRAARGRLSPTT